MTVTSLAYPRAMRTALLLIGLLATSARADRNVILLVQGDAAFGPAWPAAQRAASALAELHPDLRLYGDKIRIQGSLDLGPAPTDHMHFLKLGIESAAATLNTKTGRKIIVIVGDGSISPDYETDSYRIDLSQIEIHAIVTDPASSEKLGRIIHWAAAGSELRAATIDALPDQARALVADLESHAASDRSVFGFPQESRPAAGEPVMPEEPVPPPKPQQKPEEPPPAPVVETPPPVLKIKKFELAAGGYIQPQFRLRQSAPALGDETALDGFRLSRARAILEGTYHLDEPTDVFAHTEANLTSSFSLLDAYIALRGDFGMDRRAGWRIRLGQQYTPFSRQTFVSDAESQLPEKSQLAQGGSNATTVTPNRQLGLSVTANLPYVPWVELSLGAFNGKGINLVDNSDSNLMYVGRLAIRPIAPRAPITEGPFGPDQLSVAVDGAWVVADQGVSGGKETTLTSKYVGIDGFASWRGLSAEFEWAYVRRDYNITGPGETSFGEQGLNLQAGYLLPILGKHLEVSARMEEIDRNDTIPITMPGDPNQSQRLWWLCVTWYQLQHNLKLQLAGVHVDEIEDRVGGTNASAVYPNDFLLLQATVRYL
jgi:hypothetical protein